VLFLALVLAACGRGVPTASTPTTVVAVASPAIFSPTPIPPDPATLTPLDTTPPASAPPATPTLPNTPTPSPSPTPPAGPVVIISIDGLRADAAQEGNLPHLHGLAARGAFTWLARTVFPPVTLPAHTSMLSGLLPDAHGVDWNDYEPERGPIPLPLFEAASAAGLEIVMVVGKEKFAHFNTPGVVDRYTFVTTGDQGVADQAMAEAALGFDLMFVHLPNTDFFGHSTGWMSATYKFQLTRTDDALGRLLDALPADATIIVTADHGGHGLVHGSNIPEDMNIPWVIAGPATRPGHALGGAVTTVDTAATAAHVLGLDLPPDVSGRPVLEAFEGAAAALPDLLRGAWHLGATQRPARSEMPAVFVEGLFYVPGGFGGEGVFQAYDPRADAWLDLPPLPAPRHHLSAAAAGGRIYLFGGAPPGGFQATTTAYVYDPAAAAWTQLPDMPEPRVGAASVALNGKLYVVGGAGSTAALLEFDPARNAWRTLPSMAAPRDHLAAAVAGGEIYALGGRWPGLGEMRSIEIYDPLAGAWRDGPPMPRPHAGFGAATLRGRIVSAGGEILMTGNETQTSYEVYDPLTGTWAAGPDLPYPVHGVPVAADGQRLYLLGGAEVAGTAQNPGRLMIYTP
jgi:hypothetical protein